MTYEELEAEALKLDPQLRTRLAQTLAQSLAPKPKEASDNEAERLWIQEAMRRSRELRAAQPPPGEGPDRFLAGAGEDDGAPPGSAPMEQLSFSPPPAAPR